MRGLKGNRPHPIYPPPLMLAEKPWTRTPLRDPDYITFCTSNCTYTLHTFTPVFDPSEISKPITLVPTSSSQGFPIFNFLQIPRSLKVRSYPQFRSSVSPLFTLRYREKPRQLSDFFPVAPLIESLASGSLDPKTS